ncbi:hypothetical protein ACLX1H_003664 [Fusarium chlamydosporum]
MVKLGKKLIEHLQAIFREAELRGYSTTAEFVHLRSAIIVFVSNCRRMNFAQAREKCPLLFTDGSQPQAQLIQPPANFDIEDKRAQLNAANTAQDFIEIMKTPNKPKSARKDSKKKGTGKKRSLSPPESPTSKVQRRTEAAVTSKITPTTEQSLTTRIKLTNRDAKGVAGSPVSKTSRQTNHQAVPGSTNEESFNQANQAMSNSMEIDSSGGNDAEKNGTSIMQQATNNEVVDQSATSPNPQQHQEDTQMEDVSVKNVEGHLSPFCRSDILEIVTAAQDITANRWDEFKPKLLTMLDKLQADPTPKQSEAAIRRLQYTISSIEQERSLIPTEKWEKYEAKLIRKAKEGVFDSNWETRLSKIGRIIYFEEEEAAMQSQDWGRLRAAARTWTILAEVTGPVLEEGDEQRSNEWLLQKLGDIDFLEKMFACKKRLAAIKGPSQESGVSEKAS